MKNLLLILLVFLSPKANLAPAQADIETKILGQWIFEKTKSTEQLPDGVIAEHESGLVGKMAVYFKSDNTGNFNFADKDSEPFSWSITKNKITLKYSGTNDLCQAFNGDFKVILRERKGNQKLEFIRSNFSISLSR